MIFALEKDDGSLFLFPSLSEAESGFEAIDVENGEYEFYDDSGQQLVAEMTKPARAFRAGGYRLKPGGAADKGAIMRIVARAKCLVQGASEIRTLEDLRRVYGA